MGVLSDAYGVRVPTAPGTDQPMLRRWMFAVAAGALLVYNALFFAISAGFGVLAVPASALLAGPVLWACYRPLLAWAVMTAAVPLVTGLGLALDSEIVPQPWLFDETAAQLPVLYVLALSSTWRVTAIAFAVTVVSGLAVTVPQDMAPDRLARSLLAWVLALLLAVVLGHARRLRRQATLRIAEEYGRVRLLEERARIARELHDVVAHHMSVIAVQAASAPYRIEGGVSEAAAREFAAINAAARESLRDMRHLLGALRGSDDEPRTEPQPGLGDLGRLAESVRRAGVPVELTVPEPAPSLSPVDSVTVYRIVQEALSNVVRHAPGARTTVSVHAGDGAVTVTVRNERPARPVGNGQPGTGLGLVGMRERVAAIGGELTAEANDSGGFTVHARLPAEDGGDWAARAPAEDGGDRAARAPAGDGGRSPEPPKGDDE
ncbi:sensor histidine kinase [Nonomuraea sp. SYSU D8015]|uniref:sensor histidine kinase n=1 Tax=Nonomuraea sp. SYSU D8015 TaxID=2593644 RepID=UPI0016616D20|nr:sensor histidine kinase [Nonomuraea sp. SYSU D8015]